MYDLDQFAIIAVTGYVSEEMLANVKREQRVNRSLLNRADALREGRLVRPVDYQSRHRMAPLAVRATVWLWLRARSKARRLGVAR